MSGSDGRPYRTELSPVSFLRRSAYVFPDKVAIVHGERRTTYREFDERVNRLASALVAAGVERGDRVAFLAPPGDPYEDFLAGGSPEHFELPVLDEEDTISRASSSGSRKRGGRDARREVGRAPEGVCHPHGRIRH